MVNTFAIVLMIGSLYTAPAKSDKTVSRLTAYIMKINPKAGKFAARLARCMVVESKRYGVPVEYLAAIGHTESHFRPHVKGKSYERGVFQLWAWAPFLDASWNAYRQSVYGRGNWPDKTWSQMSRKLKVKASMDVCISAAMAAHLLAWHLKRCRRVTPKCAAAYNSGNHKHVRRGYVWAIRRRSRAIRKLLRRP